jgi:hypothetical protein
LRYVSWNSLIKGRQVDWYRNRNWDSAIEAEFYSRLARSRSQRDQYLSIQVCELAQTHPRAAKDLAAFYFESRTDNFNDGRVLGALAKASLAINNCEDALHYFLKDLEFEQRHPNYIGLSRFHFPLLVAVMGHRSSYRDALAVWEKYDCAALFPVHQFEHAAAKSLIFFDLGEKTTAWAHADKALRAHQGIAQGMLYTISDRVLNVPIWGSVKRLKVFWRADWAHLGIWLGVLPLRTEEQPALDPYGQPAYTRAVALGGS